MDTTPTVRAVLDTRREKKNKLFPVKVRVTFMREQKYYSTPVELNEKDFQKAMTAKRRTEREKAIYNRIRAFEQRATDAAEALPVFTFTKFEDIYLTNRDASNTVSFAFDNYVAELKAEKRIGTAVSYETAKNSICAFDPKLKFADITPSWLRKYETWMLKEGNGKTTVGIYLRSLRAVFNLAAIDKSLYPFGAKKGLYDIPTGRNIKKALELAEISKIYRHKAENQFEDRAKDYWIFLYLCNGLNVKDLCLLKHKNIDGDILTYERAKTSRSKRETSKIVVSLKPQAKAIIQKWSIKSLSPESYIFPHLQKGMTPERERQTYQQLTQNINKNMKRIAEKLKIKKPITTYYARHSFATVLKRSGVSAEFISEALGHSDLKTTQSYLAAFESDTIHETTDVLTAFTN